MVNQTILTDSFHDIYKAIPLPQDYNIQVAETPVLVLRKVAKLHAAQNDLKTDMTEEIERVDKMLVERLSEAKVCYPAACRSVRWAVMADGEKAALKPIKKAIDKRENKKLDFERFTKTVDNQRGKKNKSDRSDSTWWFCDMADKRGHLGIIRFFRRQSWTLKGHRTYAEA